MQDNQKYNKAKAFKGLKIMNPNQETMIRPLDSFKANDFEVKHWETSYTPTTKPQFGFYGDSNSVQKFNAQFPQYDSIKSPDYKFYFNNSMYNMGSTPTPLKMNTGYNIEKNFFPPQTPGQTPGQTLGHNIGMNIPSMNMSPNLSFGKEKTNN